MDGHGEREVVWAGSALGLVRPTLEEFWYCHRLSSLSHEKVLSSRSWTVWEGSFFLLDVH